MNGFKLDLGERMHIVEYLLAMKVLTITVKLFMKRSGQTLVEFALIIPLLALMLFAIIQYGFIFNTFMTLRHGAQVTSRTLALASTTTNTPTDIACQAIQPMLDCANLTSVSVDTNVTVAGSSAVQVTLIYDMPLIIRFVVPNATSDILTLTAVATDRKN